MEFLTVKKVRPDHTLDFAAEELKKYLRMMMPERSEIPIFLEPGAKDGFRLGLLEDFGLPFEGEEADADSEILLRYAENNSISGAEHSYQLGRMALRSGGNLRQARLKSVWEAVFLPYDRMKAQFPVVEKNQISVY